MGSVSTIYNGVRTWLAGRALMDVALSDRSTNGVQNKIIKAKFDELNSDLENNVGNYHVIDAVNSSTDVALTLGFNLASKRQVAVALAQRSSADNKWQLFNIVTVGVPTFKNVHNVQSVAYSATASGAVRAVITYDATNDTILMHSSDSSFYALAFYID